MLYLQSAISICFIYLLASPRHSDDADRLLVRLIDSLGLYHEDVNHNVYFTEGVRKIFLAELSFERWFMPNIQQDYIRFNSFGIELSQNSQQYATAKTLKDLPPTVIHRLYQEALDDFMDSCRDRELASIALQQALLRKALDNAAKMLRKSNLLLTIPSKELHHYYHLNTTACTRTATGATLHLEIPVRRKNIKFRKLQLLRAPFRSWGDQSCLLNPDPDNEQIIARNNDMLPIKNDINCQFLTDADQENEICHVPVNSEQLNSASCLGAILKGRPSQVVSDLCSHHITCSPGRATTNVRKLQNKLIISHNPPLNISCNIHGNQYETTIKKQLYGILEVEPHCACKITSSSLNIPETNSCTFPVKAPKIYNTFPVQMIFTDTSVPMEGVILQDYQDGIQAIRQQGIHPALSYVLTHRIQIQIQRIKDHLNLAIFHNPFAFITLLLIILPYSFSWLRFFRWALISPLFCFL